MRRHLARRLWLATEPVHALVYFAPEAKAAYDAAGLRGWWMGYFAGRSAAMGAVGAEVVAATFYNFHPAMVARAIPDAWGFATPSRVLQARFEATDAALRRVLGPLVEDRSTAAAADLLQQAVATADPAGRPLFAAHQGLPWPEEPHLRLWHGATLLREHRGAGHVVALVSKGIDGIEAHLTLIAEGTVTAEIMAPNRGWSPDDWEAARDRLRDRGWLRRDGELTAVGHAVRDAVEARTDELASAPLAVLGEDGAARLLDLMQGPLGAVAAAHAIPYPNPIGLPAPGPRS